MTTPLEGSFPKGNLMFFLTPTGENTEARLRVDTKYGYVSYSMKDKEKAMEIFKNEGIRLRLCKNIFDDGYVVAGEPLPKDSK
jgi:hypothetical protein